MKQLIVVAVALAVVAGGCGGDDGADSVVTGQVPFDLAFIDAMVPHHRSAIEMAEAAKAGGLTQPELGEIANDVIGSQQREIKQMLDWREEWYGSRALGPVLPEVLGVPERELGMEHGGEDVAGAVDVDLRFAQLMIPHHEGAIAIAEAADERAQRDEIKNLALAIIEAQESEIEIMEKHASGEHHG